MSLLAMVGLVTVAMVGLPAFAEGEQQPVEPPEVAAAPGVAERLLAAAGIDPNYRQGRERGNHVADVARAMGPGTTFDGVAASELVAYECAVATFLREGRVGVTAHVSRQACATVPNPPQDLEVTAGDEQLVVVWEAPVDSDGVCTAACDAPVTGYTVTLAPADAGPIMLDAEQSSSVVEGLTNDTPYTVSVVATNRIGDSAAATAQGTPQAGGLRFTAISAGGAHTCGIADDAAYCWGSGGNGRLGYGNDTHQSRPVEVATDGGSALPAGATVTAISAGQFHTCAVADGAAYCWGFGFNGRLGNGTTDDQSRPVEVATDGDSDSALPAEATVTAISAGNDNTCAVADGAAYCWGYGVDGDLGNGTTTTSQLVPVEVATDGDSDSALPADATVTAISAGGGHTCAVADGAAYCWGYGPNGQLGNGTTTSQLVPVEVATDGGSALPADATVTGISAGLLHTCAVADGAAYCWGSGFNGRLGNGTTDDESRPVEVATDGDSALPAEAKVTGISAGQVHTCAVADGAAYCWGSGGFGQLGNGTTDNQSRPVEVATDGDSDSALPAEATVTGISAGSPRHTCAVADGAAYCWGWESTGRLGNSTTTSAVTNQLRPVAVLPPA